MVYQQHVCTVIHHFLALGVPSDYPAGWNSKLKLNVSVWTVIFALNMVERQYSSESECVYCASIGFYCANLWHDSSQCKHLYQCITQCAIHVNAHNADQHMQIPSSEYEQTAANIAICILDRSILLIYTDTYNT